VRLGLGLASLGTRRALSALVIPQGGLTVLLRSSRRAMAPPRLSLVPEASWWAPTCSSRPTTCVAPDDHHDAVFDRPLHGEGADQAV